MNDFNKYLSDVVEIVNNKLKLYMNKASFPGRESSGFDVMLNAMSYSLEDGGKRIRPFLCVEFCRLFGGNTESAYAPACAIEMVHTYSLIHDDLPCMDDDDIRRGKPSNHIKFGYANALLAGDALLTLAFETIAGADGLEADIKNRVTYELSVAAGPSGMIAGQVMDLDNEGKNAPIETVRQTDILKTGKMICASGRIGSIVAEADEKQLKTAQEYCENIGLAFQVVDDILDVTSSDEVLGKPVGSDDSNNKSTYVTLLGLDGAKKYARELTDNAIESVKDYDNNDMLISLAGYLCDRLN